jgi:hypothetical protein
VISKHAVERYRERVEKQHAARSDGDLANLLDDRIRSSERSQSIIDTRAVDSTTRVFEIEHHDGEIYFAVVRDQTCVTVLDKAMLDLNFENGSWKQEPMNKPFAALRSLSSRTPAPVQIAPGVLVAREPESDPIDDVVAEPTALSPTRSQFLTPKEPGLIEISTRHMRAMVDARAAEIALKNALESVERAKQTAYEANEELQEAMLLLQEAVDREVKGTTK